MLREEKEALIYTLDNVNDIMGDASVLTTQEERDYLIKLIENDLNG